MQLTYLIVDYVWSPSLSVSQTFFLNCSNIIRLIYLEKEKNAMELQSPVKANIALNKAKQAKKTLFKAFAIEDRNQNSLSTQLC